MKTIKTLSSRIAALLLVVTVGITALPPAAVSMAAVPAAREARAGLGLPVEAASAAWAAAAATAAEPDADTDSMTKGKPHLTMGLPFCLFCYLMQLEQGL